MPPAIWMPSDASPIFFSFHQHQHFSSSPSSSSSSFSFPPFSHCFHQVFFSFLNLSQIYLYKYICLAFCCCPLGLFLASRWKWKRRNRKQMLSLVNRMFSSDWVSLIWLSISGILGDSWGFLGILGDSFSVRIVNQRLAMTSPTSVVFVTPAPPAPTAIDPPVTHSTSYRNGVNTFHLFVIGLRWFHGKWLNSDGEGQISVDSSCHLSPSLLEILWRFYCHLAAITITNSHR